MESDRQHEGNNIGLSETDDELIAAARELNASFRFHLRKSVQEFWKLGEVLDRLSRRPSAKRRWRKTLKEIGINRQSDNHARRLHAAVNYHGLGKYRNKTHALRDLGILPPAPAKTKERPDGRSKPAPVAARSVPAVIEPNAGTASNPSDPPQVGRPIAEGRPTSIENGAEGKRAARKAPPIPIADQDPGPLAVLAGIATRLEYLIEEKITITPEVVAQIDRGMKALDVLRGKGVAGAAA